MVGRNDPRLKLPRDDPHRPVRRPTRRPAEIHKAIPQEKTHAEEFYYKKQMSGRTPMVVKMTGGEEFQGWIEWYDRGCIKLNREEGPNLLIMKACIKYMHKKFDETGETVTSESMDSDVGQ